MGKNFHHISKTILPVFQSSKIPGAQAKEAYPEWYERVMANGQKATHENALTEDDIRSALEACVFGQS